jgi:hypothetical protein
MCGARPPAAALATTGAIRPTPIFGRFIETDRTGSPVALVGRDNSVAIDEKHTLCFRGAAARMNFPSTGKFKARALRRRGPDAPAGLSAPDGVSISLGRKSLRSTLIAMAAWDGSTARCQGARWRVQSQGHGSGGPQAANGANRSIRRRSLIAIGVSGCSAPSDPLSFAKLTRYP